MHSDFVDFIQRRVRWLEGRPRDIDGILLCRDHRDEAGMLYGLIEELERATYEPT